MMFYLGRLTIGSREWIEIDEKRFAALRDQKANLIRALEIEERFDILLGNYREFEEDILTMALRHSVVSVNPHNEWYTQRRELNRRIANFLSSARLYLDHLRHNLSYTYGADATPTKAIVSLISDQYGRSLSYRLMEALRNHVQHRGLAAPSLAVKHSLTEVKPGAQIACTVTPQMVKKYLLADSKLSAKIRTEIEELPDATDLKPHIREYMGCLGIIHEQVRVFLDEDWPNWERAIQEAMNQFKTKFGIPDASGTVGLAIFSCQSQMSSTVEEKHDIFMDFIEYRRHLREVNRISDRLASRFATGQQQDLMQAK